MRPLRVVAWGLALVVLLHAIATYGLLPERIPVHLGLDGMPDRFADRSLAKWLLLPLLLLVLQALFEFLARVIVRRPDLVNIPDKERYVALPPRWRAGADAAVVMLLDATRCGLGLVLGMVQWHLTQIALGGTPVPQVVVLLAPMALTVVLLLHVARITSAVDASHREWVAAGSPRE